MAKNVATIYQGREAGRQKMRKEAPEIARAFETFYQTAMKEGALLVREKELFTALEHLEGILRRDVED